ncbi:MAG: hypothetical protein HC802_01170 [Caldilineaceae bacterium]|nr:hypothetical protein [Caldilineaceae bacterium]
MTQNQSFSSGQNPPSATDQMLSAARSPLGLVIIGLVIGLIIGLFYAWQIAPVQWTSATLDELSPELQAEYLAMVAEAYVYSGGPDAAATANARLEGFDDPAAEIAAAIAYYEENPDLKPNARIHAANLNTLATDLALTETELAAAKAGPRNPRLPRRPLRRIRPHLMKQRRARTNQAQAGGVGCLPCWPPVR